MESDEKMTLRDLPVDTENYTIIDNVTGKPIDEKNYSLSIDKEVINKLNKLKSVSEEKIKQASLKNQYQDSTLVDTFTPDDTSVFTPIYKDEYIDYDEFMEGKKQVEEETKAMEENQEEAKKPELAEVIKSDTILDRVVARKNDETNSQAIGQIEPAQVPAEESLYSKVTDNSLFTPDMAQSQPYSQTINVDTSNLGEKKKKGKKAKKRKEKIALDKSEIKAGRGVAWLAYILFFLPLLFKRHNRFVRLHANEGLELNIIEILGVALILPFLLVKNAVGTMHLIITICAIAGFVLLTACILTIIPMIFCSLCGLQFQIPWLWKKRMIHVDE